MPNHMTMKLGTMPSNQDRKQQCKIASAWGYNNFCQMIINKVQAEIQSACFFFKGPMFTQGLILLSGIDHISLWRKFYKKKINTIIFSN